MTWLRFLLCVDDAPRPLFVGLWREPLKLSRLSEVLLPLSSLLDCSSSSSSSSVEDLESRMSRGKYENLNARDILADKLIFCLSSQSAMFFCLRSRASALLLSRSRILVSLILSSILPSSSILRKNASLLLFSKVFVSNLIRSSFSSCCSFFIAFFSSFSAINLDSKRSLRFSASLSLLSLYSCCIVLFTVFVSLFCFEALVLPSLSILRSGVGDAFSLWGFLATSSVISSIEITFVSVFISSASCLSSILSMKAIFTIPLCSWLLLLTTPIILRRGRNFFPVKLLEVSPLVSDLLLIFGSLLPG